MRSEVLLIILGMAIVTYFTRAASLVLFRITGIPSWLNRWLRYVPVAILTALIVPALLLPQGQLDISMDNHYLIAGLVAAVAAYKSRNIIITLGLWNVRNASAQTNIGHVGHGDRFPVPPVPHERSYPRV